MIQPASNDHPTVQIFADQQIRLMNRLAPMPEHPALALIHHRRHLREYRQRHVFRRIATQVEAHRVMQDGRARTDLRQQALRALLRTELPVAMGTSPPRRQRRGSWRNARAT